MLGFVLLSREWRSLLLCCFCCLALVGYSLADAPICIASGNLSNSLLPAVPPADTNHDGEIRLAAMSDLEGFEGFSKMIAEELAGRGVDLVVVAGDLYEDEGHRKHPVLPDSTDNVAEMVADLRPLAALGVPVYVIAGNHESRAVYAAAMAVLARECPNVVDINARSVDLDGLNIVGMGGYHQAGRGAPDAFVIGPEDYARARANLADFAATQPGEPVVFLSHSPPLGAGNEDYVEGFGVNGHTGDPALAAILDELPCWHLCGHIHQRGGEQEAFARGVSRNVASVTPYYNPGAPNVTLFRVTPAGLDVIPVQVDDTP